MKRIKKYLIMLSLIAVTIFLRHSCTVQAAQEDDIFKELYMEYRSVLSDQTIDIYRIKQIDKDSHTYIISGTCKLRPGVNPAISWASNDIYEYSGRPSYAKRYIEGTLQSQTARIKEFRVIEDPETKTKCENNKQSIFCLPENEDKKTEYDRNNEDKAYRKTEEDSETPLFSVNYTPENITNSRCGVYQLVVEDNGKTTVCTIITNIFGTDYKSFEAIGCWDDKSEWSECTDKLTLYDGTDGKESAFPEKYQYGSSLNWQTGDYKAGINEDGSLKELSSISLPEGVHSIRVKYENTLPEPGQAIFLGMPGSAGTQSTLKKRDEVFHNYLFYHNKIHAVSINGGSLYPLKEGEVSPELKLRKGLNVICVIGNDINTMKTAKYYSKNYDEIGMVSYVLLVYSNEDSEGYTVQKQKDASLKKIEIYQGASDEDDAKEHFQQIKITESKEGGEEKKSIAMNSSYPYVWINAVTNDPEASVEVGDATEYLGGYFKRLDSKKKYFDIQTVSADGSTKQTERIYVDWTLSSAELQKLSILSGATMEKKYSPDTTSYYCKKGSSGKIVLSYETSENTTTDVYVDRQKKTSIQGAESKNLIINADVHEVQWTITTDNGKKVRYKIYFNREKTGTISETTRTRAKKMIDKMVAGGYKEYLQNTKGTDYWKTFGAAAIGEDYLKNMLGYDVTKKEFRQATDYAAIILELVISGENPYDYLGVNYVEGLMSFNDNGDFGMYSANIWALSALQAAGAPVPKETVDIVKRQACSETFDLDMRGWALYAVSLYNDAFTEEEYAKCINSIKNVEIQDDVKMNGINVTGCFENFYYTNRNVMSHACMVTGLTAQGIDVGSGEFDGENGKNPLNILEDYQLSTGGWFYSPENPSQGGWNKDAVIAVGDLYNGSNVYTRYYLTPSRYKKLLDKAEKLLAGTITEDTKREALQKAYEEAEKYADEDNVTSEHGDAYYALQEAMYAVDESVKPGVFLGTAEEREQVNAVIKAIDSISSYSYKDKTKLDSIKKQYDALKEKRLFHYVTNADVLDKVYQYVNGIDIFLEKTEKIGKVNLTKTAKIERARKAYDSLNEQQKKEDAVQKAFQILSKAETKLKDAKTADNVVQAIKALGEIVTLDSEEDIESVRVAYESLTDSQKTFVTNIGKLKAQEDGLKKLQQQEENKEAVRKVSDLIDKIGRVTANSADDLRQARTAYDALENDEAKRLVSNYAQLEDGEKIYANLQHENVIYDVVDKASYEISQIDTAYGESADITAENADAVREAVQKAENYIKEKEQEYAYFRLMISNYMDLSAAKTALVQYELSEKTEASVEEFKQAVGEITGSGIEEQAVIERAEILYELLTEEDKLTVTEEYTLLQQAEEAFSIWQAEFDNVQEVVYGTEQMGDVTITGAESYQEVKDAYDMLSENAKKLLPDEIKERLSEAADTYQQLIIQQEKTEEVVEKINDASIISDLSDEEAVKAARKAYDALENPYRVTNYETLLEEEKEILSLKKVQENQEFANTVITQINALKKVTLSDKEKVEAARRAYDGLTDAQKNLVDNLSVLEAAESQIESLQKQPSKPAQPQPAKKTDTKKTSYKKIVLKKKSLKKTIYFNGKKQRYSLILFVNNKAVKAEKIKWKSSKRTIVSVSKNGKLTVKKAGKVTITASYKGKRYKYNLVIKKVQLKLKKKSITIKKGKAAQIKSVASPKGKIQYKSLDTKTASVTKKGKVVGKKKGKTKIRVSCNGLVRYCKITVK